MAKSKYTCDDVSRFFMGEIEFPPDYLSSSDDFEDLVTDGERNLVSGDEMIADPMGSGSGSDSSASDVDDDVSIPEESTSKEMCDSESGDNNDDESSDVDSDRSSDFADCGKGSVGGQGSSRGRGNGRGRGRGRGKGRGQSNRGNGRGRGNNRGRGRGEGGRGTPQGKSRRMVPSTIPSSAKSITVEDTTFVRAVPLDFVPVRCPGPHVPHGLSISPLSLFQLYFDADAIDRIMNSTLEYAEAKKTTFPAAYEELMKMSLTKDHVYSFIAVLCLLGIHNVRNHRYAWCAKKAQVLVRLRELMSCRNYELIGTFLHVVTPQEEAALAGNKLRKLLPLHEHIKAKCIELYQPMMQLSVDERMVKSKGRSKFRQYMKNKPTKWGMKYWVVADITGYTLDFDLYVGREAEHSENGLSYDVVMKLVHRFAFQGYEVYFDNFYTSPTLLKDLLELEIVATGTLNVQRKNVPVEVISLKKAVEKSSISRGTGYYFRGIDSKVTYCVWHDTKTVALASTAYPGHSKETVLRRTKDRSTNQSVVKSVPCPEMLMKYNESMGGVDKSDQYISYHKISRKTAKYWKTCFFHLVDVALVNSHILYNWIQIENDGKVLSENEFRDQFILEIIAKHGVETRPIKHQPPRCPMSANIRISHGSSLFPSDEKSRCVYCYLHNTTSYTQRKCPDCLFTPALCQTSEKNCHAAWHGSTFSVIRRLWYNTQMDKEERKQQSGARPKGRPKGSINRKRRRGNYRSRMIPTQ